MFWNRFWNWLLDLARRWSQRARWLARESWVKPFVIVFFLLIYWYQYRQDHCGKEKDCQGWCDLLWRCCCQGESIFCIPSLSVWYFSLGNTTQFNSLRLRSPQELILRASTTLSEKLPRGTSRKIKASTHGSSLNFSSILCKWQMGCDFFWETSM